jgi:hypothetical protein
MAKNTLALAEEMIARYLATLTAEELKRELQKTPQGEKLVKGLAAGTVDPSETAKGLYARWLKTVDIYGHLTPGANREPVDRLDDVISNPIDQPIARKEGRLS